MSDLSTLIPVPVPGSINSGVENAHHATMVTCFGRPGRLTDNCSPLTNAKLKACIVTESVGPFRVTALKPAIVSLRRIFTIVKAKQPQVYAEVKTAGGLCCRAVRGSKTNFSNHSWGSAIDLYFGDYVDRMGDGKCQKGLLALYPYFHQEGWFWGAEWQREDAMHFEGGEALVQQWAKELGLL